MLTRDYIRQRAKTRLPLTESASAILDKLKQEDPDLGGGDSFGEILPPDDVTKPKGPENEDENEPELQTISPLMRRAFGEETEQEETPSEF